jgi:hypothetical protein
MTNQPREQILFDYPTLLDPSSTSNWKRMLGLRREYIPIDLVLSSHLTEQGARSKKFSYAVQKIGAMFHRSFFTQGKPFNYHYTY